MIERSGETRAYKIKGSKIMQIIDISGIQQSIFESLQCFASNKFVLTPTLFFCCFHPQGSFQTRQGFHYFHPTCMYLAGISEDFSFFQAFIYAKDCVSL